MTTADHRQGGLRERKKRRTREALVDAAYRLFAEQGFEATTVEQIAERVDVSPRTFFRYFASKEDAALSLQDRMWEEALAVFAAQPPSLSVLAAARAAMAEVVPRIEAGAYNIDSAGAADLRAVVIGNPRLCAMAQQRQASRSEAFLQRIAERIGAGPADPRPALLVSLILAATHHAVFDPALARSGRGVEERIDWCLARLEEGVDEPAAHDPPP